MDSEERKMLCRVNELAETYRRKNTICVLAAIDIKNALNTLSWNKILQEAEEKRTPQRLLMLLSSYLEDRKIIIHNKNGSIKRGVFAGVPQVSILGPLL
jgi:hypothetical protein